jgi:predicted hydrocarbon binding protein
MQTDRRTEVTLRGDRRQPFILISHTFLENMFTPLIKFLQNSGYPIIYSMGRESGIQEVRQLREEQNDLDTHLVKREMLEKALNRLSQMGWGKITVAQYGFVDGEINIKIKFNPFTQECRSETKTSCTFLKGLISGIASEILEEDMQFSDPICQVTKDETCLLHLRASMK